jgi:hypothetical protein
MIHNIHILINPDATVDRTIQAQTELQVVLIEAHRRGEHPWGSKRRECPLCQQGQ